MNNLKNNFHFFAMMSRMKYINRWGLMRNTRDEDLSQHSLEVAIIAHAIATIKNKRFGGNINPERAAILGLYHDSSEIFTGDLPTPVKYQNPEIYDSYKKVELFAKEKLLNLLPTDMREEYRSILFSDDEDLSKIVKLADKLSALIKCIEEENAGNREFIGVKNRLLNDIKNLKVPEAEVFLTHFLPSFSLSLDEQE